MADTRGGRQIRVLGHNAAAGSSSTGIGWRSLAVSFARRSTSPPMPGPLKQPSFQSLRGEQTLRAVTRSGGRLRWPTSNRNPWRDCLGIRRQFPYIAASFFLASIRRAI